jgi:hypothetical protein
LWKGQRLTAIALAADALGEDGWHLSLQDYDLCARHPDVQSETQARKRLRTLGIDPQTASIYIDEDEEGKFLAAQD